LKLAIGDRAEVAHIEFPFNWLTFVLVFLSFWVVCFFVLCLEVFSIVVERHDLVVHALFGWPPSSASNACIEGVVSEDKRSDRIIWVIGIHNLGGGASNRNVTQFLYGIKFPSEIMDLVVEIEIFVLNRRHT
jgi:hypothetical protein